MGFQGLREVERVLIVIFYSDFVINKYSNKMYRRTWRSDFRCIGEVFGEGNF